MQAYTYDTATRLPVAHTAVSSFTYNADNRLTFNAYDANNRLASVTCNTVTPYSYDAAYRLPFARSYVFGSYIDEPLRMTSLSGVFYYHANQIYSVAALTDSTGAAVERYTYDPYGKVKILAADGTTVRSVSTYGNPWTFTGRRLDGETGLMYYRARMYSTELGRFVGRDFNPQETEVKADRLNYDGNPASGDGYQNGYSFYNAYFAPRAMDPLGFEVTDKPNPKFDYEDELLYTLNKISKQTGDFPEAAQAYKNLLSLKNLKCPQVKVHYVESGVAEFSRSMPAKMENVRSVITTDMDEAQKEMKRWLVKKK